MATTLGHLGQFRREEVAVLAGVSADYDARLEQGRERTPSAQVVDAHCTARLLSQMPARTPSVSRASLPPSRARTGQPRAAPAQ